MFKLVVECSKDIKKIVIDFGDETQIVTEANDSSSVIEMSHPVSQTVMTPKTEYKESYLDRMVSKKTEPVPVKKAEPPKEFILPDVTNRPVSIDDNFNEEF